MSVRLARSYRSASEAERVWRSVQADNPGFVSGRLEGSRVTIELSGTNPASLRMTLDDLVACLAAAETAGEAAGPGARSKRPAARRPGGQKS